MNLTIYRGEYLGIIGRTGSGQVTLIQHLNADPPHRGGGPLPGAGHLEQQRADPQHPLSSGLVFQYPEYQLFEETVYKDIAFGPGT